MKKEIIASFLDTPSFLYRFMDYSILSRSYDLRGIYWVDIDDDFYYRLGYAFVRVTWKNRIALGYDARLSAIALKSAFIRGANLAWATIIDIGLISSDMLSFATCHYDDIGAWVMITASHNPKEYNGMKSMNHKWEPYNLKKYGGEMVKIMEEMDGDSFPHSDEGRIQTSENTQHGSFVPQDDGKIEHRNVLEDWIDHIISFVGRDVDFSQYTIVADGGNGAAGTFMTRLAERAGFTMIPLYLDPDWDFPNHHPNPMLEKNRVEARQKLLDRGADIAFCFDGDADRIMIIDDRGDVVTSGVLSSVITHELSTKYPKAGYIGNVTISHIFRDTVKDIGWYYEKEMVGHVYIREHMMKDTNIVYAGEHSAHYFFRDNYYMDSGIMAGMVFLASMARQNKKISEVTDKYARYFTLEETNFEVPDPKWAIEKLAEIYKYEKYDIYDGITVEYDDGSWWNFRPSSNEPLLRFNMEARTQERFDELHGEIMRHIRTFWEASGD
jgi:phosphomannomutase